MPENHTSERSYATLSATNLLTNGNFANGLNGWTNNGNWYVEDGVLYHTAGSTNSLSQYISLTNGKTYAVFFQYSSRDSCTSSYSNSGGTGNRSSIITILASQTASGVVDGNTGDVGNVLNLGSQVINSSDWVRFDFGASVYKIITEAKFHLANGSFGTWRWQGSDNGSSWTNIGASFTPNGASSPWVNTTMSANTNAYRYYRMVGVSGSSSGNSKVYEIEFKICEPNIVDELQIKIDGNILYDYGNQDHFGSSGKYNDSYDLYEYCAYKATATKQHLFELIPRSVTTMGYDNIIVKEVQSHTAAVQFLDSSFANAAGIVADDGNKTIIFGDNAATKLLGNEEYPQGISRKNNVVGKNNLIIGHDAAKNTVDGTWATCVGVGAGENAKKITRGTYIGYQAGGTDSPNNDVCVGFQAGKANRAGYNTFVGAYAGYNAGHEDQDIYVYGHNITAIGYFAGAHVQLGRQNVFIGSYAGQGRSSFPNHGSNNSYIGYYSGANTTTGSYNTFMGHFSGARITTGIENTFIGQKAGFLNTGAGYNTFIGSAAGYNNVSGSFNTFIGRQAGYENITGYHNTFVGSHAGYDNDSGVYNTFIGIASGRKNTAGNNNTFIGKHAGYDNKTASSCTFVGARAGVNNVTGDGNVFVGMESGLTNSTGYYNTFVGHLAGYYTNASNNTFLGRAAGFSNTSGQNNAFLAGNSGYANTTGSYNTFLGNRTGESNIEGNYNTFAGQSSGISNTTGVENTFHGYLSGANNINGDNNTFLGTSAGYTNSSGSDNVFVGRNSGYSNTTSDLNTFIGYAAGFKNTTGTANVHIGPYAGNDNTIGNYNTSVGRYAGYATTGNNNVCLGYNAGATTMSGNNNVMIGSSAYPMYPSGNTQININNLIYGYSNNIGIGVYAWGTSAQYVLGFKRGTAPTTAANSAQVWGSSVDPYPLMAMDGRGRAGAVVSAYVKATTGHPLYPYEGMMEINTFDDKIYIYAEGVWRQIATW